MRYVSPGNPDLEFAYIRVLFGDDTNFKLTLLHLIVFVLYTSSLNTIIQSR